MQTQRLSQFGDREVAALLQSLYMRLLGENMLWNTFVEVGREIDALLKGNRLPKDKVGVQKHNLNVLHDYMLIHKATIQGLRTSLDKVDADLDRRGYTKDERDLMKVGAYVW